MHFIYLSPLLPEEQSPHYPQTEEQMILSAAHCNPPGDITLTVLSSVL